MKNYRACVNVKRKDMDNFFLESIDKKEKRIGRLYDKNKRIEIRKYHANTLKKVHKEDEDVNRKFREVDAKARKVKWAIVH